MESIKNHSKHAVFRGVRSSAIKAFAFKQPCGLRIGFSPGKGRLIDIGPFGARVRLDNEGAFGVDCNVGREVTLQSGLDDRLANVPGRVDWRDRDEVGVLFANKLNMSVAELQKLF